MRLSIDLFSRVVMVFIARNKKSFSVAPCLTVNVNKFCGNAHDIGWTELIFEQEQNEMVAVAVFFFAGS